MSSPLLLFCQVSMLHYVTHLLFCTTQSYTGRQLLHKLERHYYSPITQRKGYKVGINNKGFFIRQIKENSREQIYLLNQFVTS